MPAPCSVCTRSKIVLTYLSSVIGLLSLNPDEARADRIRALASPPIMLWTDQTLSNAQHVANAISDNFGTIENFSPGTFIGGPVPPIKISPANKTNGQGN